MAFTEHSEGKPEGSYEVDADRAEYSVVYRLTSDSAEDGPQKAIAYVEAEIAEVGDYYELRNDKRESAKLRTIAAVHVANSQNPWIWLATLTYADPEPASGDEQGVPADDPVIIRPEVEVQTVQYTRPVDQAEHIVGFKSQALILIPQFKTHAVVNSALCVLDPPLEEDHHRLVIRILRNLSEFDCNQIQCNVVNNSPFVLAHRGIRVTVGPWHAKVRDISITQADWQGNPYVKVQLYMDVLLEGIWRSAVLDRGYHARAMLGDRGADGEPIYAVPEGQPPIRRLADADGLPVNEPVLLNGNGIPLDWTGSKDPVYITWKHYPEDDFRNWPILAGLIA